MPLALQSSKIKMSLLSIQRKHKKGNCNNHMKNEHKSAEKCSFIKHWLRFYLNQSKWLFWCWYIKQLRFARLKTKRFFFFRMLHIHLIWAQFLTSFLNTRFLLAFSLMRLYSIKYARRKFNKCSRRPNGFKTSRNLEILYVKSSFSLRSCFSVASVWLEW